MDDSGDEMLGKFIDNGAVELYYDNSKKLETRSDGVDIHGLIEVNGDIRPNVNNSHDLGSPSLGWKNIYLANDIMLKDDGIIKFGDGEDLQVFHDGTHSYIRDVGTGDLKITSNGNGVMLQKASTENLARFLVDGACELYHDNVKKLETTSAGGTLHGTWTGAGKILQVVQTVKTDVFTSNVHCGSTTDNFTDITGMTCSITPTSSSSKILVMPSMSCSGDSWAVFFRVLRGSTVVTLGDDAGGNRSRSTFSGGYADNRDGIQTATWNYLDSPSTTSSTTYKIQGAGRSSGDWAINRSKQNQNYSWTFSAVSTLTLMEVSA